MATRSEASRMVISMASGTGRGTQLLAPSKVKPELIRECWALLAALLASGDCHPGPLITASNVWETQAKHHFKGKQKNQLKSRQVPLQLHPDAATSSH